MRRIRAWVYYGYSLLEMLLWFRNWPALVPLFLRRSKSRVRKLKLRRPRLEILVRSAMDIWSVKETFVDQFYTRYGVPIQDGWTVVDIGAGIGDYSLYAAHWNPAVMVYAFEPYPESYALLERNLALNGIENVHALQKAVWRNSGEIQLDLSTGEPLQFTSQEHGGLTDHSDHLTVEAITLQDLVNLEKIERIDLLKMDCEGGEYEILYNASKDTLQRVERIIMEYHDIDERRTYQELMGFLQSSGYEVLRYPNRVHAEIGYLFAVRC